jgi:hypothetical protein
MRLHRHMLARISSVLLLAGAFVVVNAARADATLIVYICNDSACTGGGDFSVTDGTGGDGDLGTPGSVSFIIPGYANVSAASYPALGSEGTPILTLNYIISAAGFASFGTPWVFAAQDGFNAAGNALFEADASNGGGLANLYAGTGSIAPPFGIPNFSCAMDCLPGIVLPAPVSPYYLAVGLAPTAEVSGAANGDATVSVVPEQQSVPDGGSTATLLGSVLLGFGMLRRKFKH